MTELEAFVSSSNAGRLAHVLACHVYDPPSYRFTLEERGSLTWRLDRQAEKGREARRSVRQDVAWVTEMKKWIFGEEERFPKQTDNGRPLSPTNRRVRSVL
eukprot:m.15980 g.15980  ORF g.15980 m.15980 type:complete len:101 (+) comp26673_c0_seq2:146-448(+)